MLAYILALAVAVGSLAIYMAAFFFPEIHRKNDFIWSGVGLFYALVLWVCAGRITGGLLLGQVASVALLGWLGWQTVSLRRQLTPAQQQTEVPSAEAVTNTIQDKVSNLSLPEQLAQLPQRLGGIFSGAKDRVQQTVSKKAPQPPTTGATPPAPTAKAAVEVIDNRSTPSPQQSEATTTTEQPPEVEESPLGAEPPQADNQPAGPDMPGPSGEQITDVAEIAPEAELTPPAEPLGSGDPEERANPPAVPVEMEAAPVEMTQTPTAPPSEPSPPEAEVPELKHPNPPDPELVEAAVEDAEEKSLPSSPPDTSEENKE